MRVTSTLVATSAIICIPSQNLIAVNLLRHQQRCRLDVRAQMYRTQSASLEAFDEVRSQRFDLPIFFTPIWRMGR